MRGNFNSAQKKISKKSKKLVIVSLLIAGIATGAYEIDQFGVFDFSQKSDVYTIDEVTSGDTLETTVNNEELSNNKESIDKDNINYCVDTTVENIVSLYDELGLDSPAECLSVFCELLNDGELSKTGTYTYADDEKFNEYEFNLAYSTLNGVSLCRNDDDMLTKTLKGKGYECYSTTCYSSNVIPNVNEEKEANHQVTLINDTDNDNVYLLDPTNNTLLDNFNYTTIYSDSNSNFYNYPMPDLTNKDKGYLTSYNSVDEINTMNSLIQNDTNSFDKAYFASEKKSALKKLNSANGKYALKKFKDDMEKEVFDYVK